MTAHFGKIILEKDNYKIIFCENCKFIHVDPLPNESDLLTFYRDEFYDTQHSQYIQKYSDEIDYWNLVYDERLENIEKLHNLFPLKLLDIGCGAGFFLSRAKERKWDVLGIEPSKLAADYAKKHGIKVLENFFEKIDFSNISKFHAIHMNAVLEHSLNPNMILEKCHSLLVDDGTIVIDVPNDFNPLQKIAQKTLGKNEWWIVPTEHLNYFNFESLSNLLKKNGFAILKKESTFPLELFLLMGYDYLGNNSVGTKIHSDRMNLEKNLLNNIGKSLKNKLYSSFAEIGIGRRAIIYAKKISSKNQP